MTLEAMDTRAPAPAADEMMAPPSRPPGVAVRRVDPLDTMLGFATEGEAMACQLRGLAALFRAMFFDDAMRKSDDASAAADVIDDVLKSIAGRLDATAHRARATRTHLEREGAR